MPTYTYRCRGCGAFDLTRPIAHRGEPAQCPECHATGMRVFTAPHLSSLNPSLDRAVTSAGLSAETPQVTRSIPQQASRAPGAALRRPGHPALPTR